MNLYRTSGRRLEELRDELTGRELAVLGQIAELRFMTGAQVAAVHFPASDYAEAESAGRAARRTLQRLTVERLLVRLERRIGGRRAGSASYVYALGEVGQRLLGSDGPRRRQREPSRYFLSHALAVTQFIVDLTAANRAKDVELLLLQTEPRCWRQVPTPGGSTTLKPDAFVSVGRDDLAYDWFVEVDLGSEHLPTLLRKCALYESYYRSGIEQAKRQVFPRVLWLMHSEARVEKLARAIAIDKALTAKLFIVTTHEKAIAVAGGGQP